MLGAATDVLGAQKIAERVTDPEWGGWSHPDSGTWERFSKRQTLTVRTWQTVIRTPLAGLPLPSFHAGGQAEAISPQLGEWVAKHYPRSRTAHGLDLLTRQERAENKRIEEWAREIADIGRDFGAP